MSGVIFMCCITSCSLFVFFLFLKKRVSIVLVTVDGCLSVASVHLTDDWPPHIGHQHATEQLFVLH